MNQETNRILQAIADLLGAENDLLRRTDYAGAALLLPEKQALFARLASLSEPPKPAAAPLLGRLVELARDNQSLLARAINIQARVIGIVMQAVASAAPQGYARDGKRIAAERTGGLAISARI